MPSSLSGAEAYFAPGNHIHAERWSKQEEPRLNAAIAQARRVLSRLVPCADIETEIDVDMDNGINPEYAIYEQAIWILANVPMLNADQTLPIPEAADPDTESGARKAQTAIIAPEALRWLGVGSVALSRG